MPPNQCESVPRSNPLVLVMEFLTNQMRFCRCLLSFVAICSFTHVSKLLNFLIAECDLYVTMQMSSRDSEIRF